jgi:hypothetical protein
MSTVVRFHRLEATAVEHIRQGTHAMEDMLCARE